jgi:hypothetical protein
VTIKRVAAGGGGGGREQKLEEDEDEERCSWPSATTRDSEVASHVTYLFRSLNILDIATHHDF